MDPPVEHPRGWHAEDEGVPIEKQIPAALEIVCVASVQPPPNGGWDAWSQVLAGHIVTFFTWGFITSFGMFQAHYTSIGLSTPSNISWIGALTVFFLLSVPLLSGAAADTGHFKLVLRLGIGLWLLGIFSTSLCRDYWHFVLAQGLCIGLGNGCMFVPMMSVVSTYFDASRRSFAMGIVLCGSGTGGLVIPIMLNRLISLIGFGWAVRTLGFMALVMLLAAERWLKKRLPPKDSVKMLEPNELKDVVFDLFVSLACRPHTTRFLLTRSDPRVHLLLRRLVVRLLLRQRICTKSLWLDPGGVDPFPACPQCRRHPRKTLARLRCRPLLPPAHHQPDRQLCYRTFAVLLDCREVNTRHVHLRRPVRASRSKFASHVSSDFGGSDTRYEEERDSHGHGLCVFQLWMLGWWARWGSLDRSRSRWLSLWATRGWLLRYCGTALLWRRCHCTQEETEAAG